MAARAMARPSAVEVPRPDLVEEDERVAGGVVEDFGQLAHLAHERGLAARDVVGRADAGEHAVEDR